MKKEYQQVNSFMKELSSNERCATKLTYKTNSTNFKRSTSRISRKKILYLVRMFRIFILFKNEYFPNVSIWLAAKTVNKIRKKVEILTEF